MEDLLKHILNKLNSLESKVDNNHKEVMSKINNLESKFDDLEVKNANNHRESMEALKEINEIVEFITHKENKIEKEVFTIKKKLEIIK